ncbi:YciI family protein [Nakamurella endophytica]|nr:YciI family protein [Nakamurella endophytica]
MIMVRSTERSRARWETLSDEQRGAFGEAHWALSADLRRSGVLVSSAGLGDPADARAVTVRDGRTAVSDGPFAEAKEYLAGFYLVEVPGLEDALAVAARVPDAAFEDVIVQPVYVP